MYCLCVGSLDGLTNRKRSLNNLFVSTKAVFLSCKESIKDTD